MAKKDIVIDGVSFSKEFIQSHKSEKDFMTAMDDKAYGHLFEGESRAEKLREVFKSVGPAEADKVDQNNKKTEKPSK